MAITETIKSSAYRVWSTALGHWKKYSLWNLAKDTEFDDGNNAETKVGAINGITDSLVANDSSVAASSAAVYELNKNLGGIPQFQIDESTGKITGYTTEIGGADTVFPFKSGGIIIPEWKGMLNGHDNWLIFDTKELTTMSIGSYSDLTLNTQQVQGSNDNSDWTPLFTLVAGQGMNDLDISAYDYVRIYFAHSTAVYSIVFTDIVLS